MSRASGNLTLHGYDFIDFGCSTGGSLEFAATAFGGRGVGLDIDPDKVALSRARGYEAYQADVSKIEPHINGKVRFAIMSHFLEHLPGLLAARACIDAAAKLTTEFFLIQQPYFDADGYLFDRGLKLYWSDWRGHTLHMSTIQLWRCLQNLQERGLIKRFVIGRRHPIPNSHCKEVLPFATAIDQVNWDESAHGPRDLFDFNVPVYRELCAVAFHDEDAIDPKVMKYLLRSDIEPRRVCRRPFGLSYAAMAGASSVA